MAHFVSLVVFDPVSRTRAALKFGFERDGFQVLTAANPAETVAMAQNRAAQLVIVSLTPGAPMADGEPDPAQGEAAEESLAAALQLIGRLREEDRTRDLPLLALGDPGDREAALRAGADEFMARPAFIRDVITLAKLAVAVRQDGDDTGVVAMLDDYELYFLVRALSAAGRSGTLGLERGRRVGEVQLVKGQVTGARLGNISGAVAFSHLLLWSEAALHLNFQTPSVSDRKIGSTTDELLTEGAKFARDFEAMAERVGGAQVVLRQVPDRVEESRAKIPAEVASLLKIYDGRRALIDIVEDSPFKPLDTIKITHRLQEMKVLERATTKEQPEEPAGSPLTAALAVRDWLLGAKALVGERSTVTEAGRRAAEAMAEEASRRELETPTPGTDLFGDTDRVRREQSAPTQVEDAPTAPRESHKFPQARNKKRKGKTGPVPKIDAKVQAKPESMPPAIKGEPTLIDPPKPVVPAVVPVAQVPTFDDAEATVPFMRVPEEPAPRKGPPPEPADSSSKTQRIELLDAAELGLIPAIPTPAPTVTEVSRIQVVAAPPTVEVAPHGEKPIEKPVPVAEVLEAKPVEKPAPLEAKPAPSVKLPGTKPAESAHADAKPADKPANGKAMSLKEVEFSDEEEEFFAREAELAKAEVDTFDDLEPSSAPVKRRWFGFGGSKPSQNQGQRKFTGPSGKAPPKPASKPVPAPPKKR